MCFSIVNPTSYENVKTKWWPEIKHNAPGVPCILVGTKEDLRGSSDWVARLRAEGRAPLTSHDGVRLAQEIGALKYIECSALTQKGLKSVFDEAIKVGSGAGTKWLRVARVCVRGRNEYLDGVSASCALAHLDREMCVRGTRRFARDARLPTA